MRKIFTYIIFICYFFIEANASEWNNFIINYDKRNYENGLQTWQISNYDNNWVYFANQNGMLEFDGNTWKVFRLNNLSDTRSVLASKRNERIYVGGINEFGYFEPNNDGRLQYICMSDSIPEKLPKIGNVWGIHENDNIMYFQGDYSVLKYFNGKYTLININAKIDCSDMVNGVLYLGTSKGVRVLIGNSFFPLNGATILNSKRIRNILPYNNGVLIVTAYSGLYYYDGSHVVPFSINIEDFLKKNEVFCAAIYKNKLALGTIHRGVVVIDLSSGKIKYFNENNGLQNQTVLTVHFDAVGNLWVGMDQGIDFICLNTPFSTLYTYPHTLGAGYTALVNKNLLYLGTNRGLYTTNYPVRLGENSTIFNQVPNSSGQVWNLMRIGKDIFCAHDRGLFLVNEKKLERIGNIQGVWTCQQVEGKRDLAYIGAYDGIFIMEKSKGKWKIRNHINNLYYSSRKFVQDSSNTLWIVDGRNIRRITLDNKLTKVINMKKYGVESGLPYGKFGISKIGNRAFFLTEKGLYSYDKNTESMQPAHNINILLNGDKKYNVLKTYKNNLISLNHDEICINKTIHTYKGSNHPRIISMNMSSIELVNNAEEIIPVSDSSFIIPNDNGFALLDLSLNTEENTLPYFMCIRNVYLTNQKDSLIYCSNFANKKELKKIKYRYNSIRFNFSCSYLKNNEKVKYQYRLGNAPWSDWTTTHYKEYSDLYEGFYTFNVRAVSPDGNMINDSYSFTINSPWYRTKIAYFCYLLLILLLIRFIYKWDDRRVKNKERLAVKQKDIQMLQLQKEYKEKQLLKEQQILSMEKEKLETELKHKSQEVANGMINLARRNKLLTEIKTDILQVLNNLKGERAKEYRKMLMNVNNKIDSNIQCDDVLKKVEEQFDLIHNNFMKRLREKYPDLSNNERLMCAYLKMNLSTKEIAPLLNISVRGVETLRYRLRKKFNLTREDNLNSFLDESI